MPIEPHRCKICTSASLIEIPEYRSLPRVTSDCVAFRSGGRLLVCPACGATQSPSDEQWFEEIREIYSDYHAYHQASGVEQHVIDPLSGELRRRSEVLVDGLLGLPGVPRSGKVLDVGCGTGATLRSFSERGGWRLYGQEMDRKNIHFLTALAGFESLYTDSPAGLPGQFDLITMVHALEHFPEAGRDLARITEQDCAGRKNFRRGPQRGSEHFRLRHRGSHDAFYAGDASGRSNTCRFRDRLPVNGLGDQGTIFDGAARSSGRSRLPPECGVRRSGSSSRTGGLVAALR